MRRVILIILIMFLTLSITKRNETLEMIGYIENTSDYEYDGSELPTVLSMSNKDVCTEIGVDYYPCNIAGFYDHQTNQIIIAQTATDGMIQEDFHDVVLIHELVHFLQFINGYYDSVPCRRALERDAFAIQDAYIDYKELSQENKNDPLFALIASMCKGNPEDMIMMPPNRN